MSLEDFDGDASKYIEHLLSIFEKDFIKSNIVFRKEKVFYDKKEVDNKPGAFVHITTETDRKTGERILSLRRCERLPWVKLMIENEEKPDVLVWSKDQKTKKRWVTRVSLFLEEQTFLVVLEKTKSGYFLITAIYIDNPNQKKKLLKEYGKYR